MVYQKKQRRIKDQLIDKLSSGKWVAIGDLTEEIYEVDNLTHRRSLATNLTHLRNHLPVELKMEYSYCYRIVEVKEDGL